jgi:hypothetical protein
MHQQDNVRGGYHFLPGVPAYASGVISLPGYEIVHVTLHRPLAYRDGFRLIDRYRAGVNRPRQSLCGIQLRSPQPQSLAGFEAFDQRFLRKHRIVVTWSTIRSNPSRRTR